MNLDSALQTFIVESRDLLQVMETCLLNIEDEEDKSESINAIFRAAHTIKGSAGLFGLDDIVAFTHVLESVLDRVRDGKLLISADMASLFLECGDHISNFIDLLESDEKQSAASRASGEKLLARLQNYLGEKTQPVKSKVIAIHEVHAHVEVEQGDHIGNDNWHISLRFGHDVLRSGMDPLSFFRYLGTIGKIVSIVTLHDAIPATTEMDPECCYMGYELNFKSDADRATIDGVFDFVRDDCKIHILPPFSKLSEYIDMIRSLPEKESYLGEILVASGALTRVELESGLKIQRCPVKREGEGCEYKCEAGEASLVCSAEAGKDCAHHGARLTKPLGEILVEQGVLQPVVLDAALEKQKQSKETKANTAQLVRVDAEKLDMLINLVGELVIATAGVHVFAQRSGQTDMIEVVSTMARLVEEVRDGALKLRMVQIGDTFNRFQRVVRDVGRELGKDIELIITGADAELDKTVVEKIGDPLMHLVRNALDHGIESAAIRQAAGKPARGTLRLNAYHDAGSIVIEIADDGAGLNRDRILQKARERGLVAADVTPSDKDIYNLIFEAGFSTAEAVTNISGRGVGMDVVKRNIIALRGTVELDSVPGHGTTVSIHLPLTLAIIDGFLVGVGKSSFVLPLDMVQECIQLSEEEREATHERNYINLRGEVLPFVKLREHFDIEGATARRVNVVVVHYAGKKAGLVVDELLGEFQTVIKPLGKLFSNLRGISGSTILGTGEVALILDVPSLVQQAVNREVQQVSSGATGKLALAR